MSDAWRSFDSLPVEWQRRISNLTTDRNTYMSEYCSARYQFNKLEMEVCELRKQNDQLKVELAEAKAAK